MLTSNGVLVSVLIRQVKPLDNPDHYISSVTDYNLVTQNFKFREKHKHVCIRLNVLILGQIYLFCFTNVVINIVMKKMAITAVFY